MISVVSPGARTLVQDLGRPGFEHLGVPTSGAADVEALRMANLLVGNPQDVAALEITLNGPILRFAADALIAYTGTESILSVDGAVMPLRQTVYVQAGQTVTVGVLRGGLRGYLAVAGGLAVDAVLGSRSACTLSGLGPAALAAGDTLPVGPTLGAPVLRAAVRAISAPSTGVVRIVLGPHDDLFDTAAVDAFLGARWTVSPQSSRVGVRLDGPALQAPQHSLPSLGMVTGAIQVPPSGQPIVLGPDHGSTGGYTVLGTVISADLPVLSQVLTGSPLSFCLVTIEHSCHTCVVSYLHVYIAVI